MDLSPWGSDKHKLCEFTILKNAILNHQIIEFNYFNTSGEKSSRKVEPIKLVFKVKAWYLQGFCLSKNANRTFKISRMSNVQVTQEIFGDRLPKELPEDIKEQSSQKWITVQLKISPQGAYRVFDEFDEKEITKNQDGSFTIETALPESEWLFGYIFSFGTDIEVLAPQNIREMTHNKLDEIIKKYKHQKS